LPTFSQHQPNSHEITLTKNKILEIASNNPLDTMDSKNNIIYCDAIQSQNEIQGNPIHSILSDNINNSTTNLNEIASPRYIDSER